MSKVQTYFLAALKQMINSGTIKQSQIAEISGIATQTINAYVKGRKAPGLSQQEEIADACGYQYIEFIQKGEAILEGELNKNHTDHEETEIPPVGNDITPPINVISSVIDLVSRYNEMEKQLDAWHTIYEVEPYRSCMIEGGVVVRQNKAHRELFGVLTSNKTVDMCTTICDCTPDLLKDCKIYDAIQNGKSAKTTKTIRGVKHLISATPAYINQGVIYTVTMVPIDMYEVEE